MTFDYLCILIFKHMKIALIGYGKMGRMIEQIATERGHDIVCIIDIDNQEDFDSKAFATADVAIEFTTPATAFGNIVKAMQRDVKVVIGSTGWMAEHYNDILNLCKNEYKTLFWSSNFSLGVFLFNKLNIWLAKLMNNYPQYDVRMKEVHHVHKLDAPSGTAITLAEGILKNMDRKDRWVKGNFTDPDGKIIPATEKAAPEDLPIESIRQGEVPGIHSVTYESNYDCIDITHNAFSRGGFALGAVLAAEYTKDHTGLLTMDDMFKGIN